MDFDHTNNTIRRLPDDFPGNTRYLDDDTRALADLSPPADEEVADDSSGDDDEEED